MANSEEQEEKQEQAFTLYFQDGGAWEIMAHSFTITDFRLLSFADADEKGIAEIPIPQNVKAIVIQPDKVKWMEAGDLSKEILDIIRSER